MSNVKQVFREIDVALGEDSTYAEGVEAVYQFNLNGEEPGVFQLILNGEDSYTTEGDGVEADCILNMASEDFIKMAEGELNGTQAFMSGRLKIKGNMGLALKLQSILAAYNKKNA
ncbi:SCP2 sterol-binding domain-containing protein [Pseudogracilibacillus auburnensis]|uniref:SCP2 sterol-binding domain-containing protein n=1 Tax=Pseudogracilibacillus auburnensis TaxID=1494959 RepID=UPI001A956527|nr:SCP2 sterol-binding domain-containing protein [Pseudogracilibacillus auburnensis]MBO1002581.1 SCP2 sterol-binding domain-containing protein [Pseudogracilibacillus auburnensis]